MLKSVMTRMMVILAAAGLTVAVNAAETSKQLTESQLKVLVQKKIKTVNPGLKVQDIEKTSVEGYYKVGFERGGTIYVSANGTHFFDGTLYDMSGPKVVNVTEEAKTKARIALMSEFKPREMIIFSPKAPMKAKAHINVFTDVDCFYCQKLHQEVPELNAMGIEVRYLAYPRAGIGSPSYDKVVSAWCSDDPQTALTKLKNRESIAPKTCDDNPVASQYQLGRKMGVTGTPAIILEDGTLIPGYKPAKDLAAILGL